MTTPAWISGARIRVPTFTYRDKGGPGLGGGRVSSGRHRVDDRFPVRGPALYIVYGRGMDEYRAETAVSPCVYWIGRLTGDAKSG